MAPKLTNWKAKTAAYLSKPPWFALFPAEDWGEEGMALFGTWGLPDFADEDLRQSMAAAEGLLHVPSLISGSYIDFRKSPVIIHPLSGQEMTLEELNDADIGMIRPAVIEILKQIAAQCPISQDDGQSFYFALWRNLEDRLVSANAGGLGEAWRHLPANPNVPCTTIWEQAAAAAAVAGAWPEPAILIFTIASAQDVVSTARRTQDTWMGSYLLSYLTWQAMKPIVERCGPDAVIFPSLHGQPLTDLWLYSKRSLTGVISEPSRADLEIGNFPNLFTAIVPRDMATNSTNLVADAVKAVKDSWRRVWQTVRSRLEDSISKSWQCELKDDYGWQDLWERQCQSFLEGLGIFWVVQPWGNDPGKVLKAAEADLSIKAREKYEDILCKVKKRGITPNIGMIYPVLSSLAGRALTARKNLRDFNQVEEPGHKCSLCGRWEALHPDFQFLQDVKEVTDNIRIEDVRNAPAEERYGDVWLGAFWGALAKIGRVEGSLKLQGRIRRGERLCAPCLTRRLALEGYFKDALGLDHHIFPSTAGMATAAYRGHLLEAVQRGNADLKKAFENYTDTMLDYIHKSILPWPAAYPQFLAEKAGVVAKGSDFLKIDGQWLLQGDTGRQGNAIDEGESEEGALPDACKTAIARLRKTAGLGAPPSYYAVLAMDGDHMGEWITSQLAPDLRWMLHPDIRKLGESASVFPSGFKRPLAPSVQLALSGGLKNFALHCARQIVEEKYPGKLVYAGGEDVLAFLPLESLFPLMRDLYTAFRGARNGYAMTNLGLRRVLGGLRKNEQTAGDATHGGMTASMGVVIAHHSLPLDLTIRQAQETLKESAKKKLDRDAFAIRLLRRSGEKTEAGCPFHSPDSSAPTDLLDRVEEVFALFREDVSGRIAYRMADTLWAKPDLTMTAGVDDGLNDARRCELEQLTRRQSAPGKQQKAVEAVLGLYDSLGETAPSPLIDPLTSRTKRIDLDPWQATADFLLLCRFLCGKEAR